MPEARKRLGDLLVEAGVLTLEKLEDALAEQKTTRKRLGELLVDHEYCTDFDIAAALSTQLNLELVDLCDCRLDPQIIRQIPESVARKHAALAVRVEGDHLAVAMADPLNLDAIADLRFASGKQILTLVATQGKVNQAIDQYYRSREPLPDLGIDDSVAEAVQCVSDSQQDTTDIRELEEKGRSAPIVRVVNHTLLEAVENKASDIHFEPSDEKLVIRFRVDGYLREHIELPKWIQPAVISRIKIMAQLDISEKRIPQDGRIGLRIGDHTVDLRISTLPTNHGEKVVIRLLDPQGMPASMEEIGFCEETLPEFRRLIARPQGIVLVIGPTGSGKTTTLYGALGEIKDVTRNITTIEDPIEYALEGVNQVSINERAGRTFASVLTAILRQDPDIVMVGEMRDVETATIAMQAALTGHLVFSTIHTNSAVATITRLRDLGVPSYLIASTISGILAQRLTRVICEGCKQPYEPSEAEVLQVGLTPEQAKTHTFYEGAGCEACGHTGFQGRTAIYELLTLSTGLREHIAKDAGEAALRQLATAQGLRTLLQHGLEKVFSGVTTVAELARVTQMDGDMGAYCQQCNNMISAGFVACPSCGQRLISTCDKCQAILDESWSFCPYCATSMEMLAEEGMSEAERFAS